MFALVCLDCTSLGSFARILQQFCWLVATLTPARAAMPAGKEDTHLLVMVLLKKLVS